jgi:ABC-type multidrug transport system fused ATPase/permease subunit
VSRAVACTVRVRDLLKYFDESIVDAVVIDDPHAAHSLEFRNVSFRYPDSGEDTLTDISFKVEKGEKIGVIGITGSGKSTVAQLASGLYAPTSGEILLDGKSVEHISRDSLYKAMSLCIQKARMFTGSIKYNISLDREGISDENIDRAIIDSCTDDVVGHKEEGKDFIVKANGAGLSGGQKQRIGIARALAGEPGLLIFDDSTSALDAATERKLLKNLGSLSNSPTMIFVSQKIKTVMDLDKILLVEDGRISAFAPHSELLTISENYRKFCALQDEEGVS